MAYPNTNLTIAQKSDSIVFVAAQSVTGDWTLCNTKKVHQRLRFDDLSAFFVPALWWGASNRELQKIEAARFPFWPLSPNSNSHPATLRLDSLCDRFDKLFKKESAMSKHTRIPTPAKKSESLTFQNTELAVIDQNGEQWLTAADISRALGYKADNAVASTYIRNQDEFDDSMTCIVKLTKQGQNRDVRVFNKRGCQLIALLSRTQKAKEFRKWALDVLESNDRNPQNGGYGENTPQITDQSVSYIIHKMSGQQIVESHVADIEYLQKLIKALHPDFLLINRETVGQDLNHGMETMQKAIAEAAAVMLPFQLLLEGDDVDEVSKKRMERAMAALSGRVS